MMAHIICIAVALKNGLGTSPALAPPKSHAVRSQAIAGPATMAAYMFLLVALAFAKSSTVMFIQRILSRDLRRLYVTCYALIAVYCLWAIGSMAAIGVGCDAGLFTSDDMDTSCGGQVSLFYRLQPYRELTRCRAANGLQSQRLTQSQSFR